MGDTGVTAVVGRGAAALTTAPGPGGWAVVGTPDWQAGLHYETSAEGRHICDERGRIVAAIQVNWQKAAAVGELLAAAPALLAALQALGAAVDAAYTPLTLPAPLRAALVDARTAIDEAGVPVTF